MYALAIYSKTVLGEENMIDNSAACVCFFFVVLRCVVWRITYSCLPTIFVIQMVPDDDSDAGEGIREHLD